MQIAADITLSIIISPIRQTRSRILRNPAKGGQWLGVDGGMEPGSHDALRGGERPDWGFSRDHGTPVKVLLASWTQSQEKFLQVIESSRKHS